ncbi:hypothetical protein I2I11_08990 [Pontibacter sp. 172403-2]|uniref:hypothetical protein n=1 Tax=Pontibacter rufus TaxID=2791028 RepID=UPI0018AFE559|nr:hypothetical protein [Pontibacter sp. 172403-2]MBF9253426.1 hypothetical protein [Pontibacter sp. 172403-2]
MKKLIFLKPLLLYAFLGLCSTACNDDDGQVPMPEPEEPACRLTKIINGTYGPTVIQYNAQGYVTKLTDEHSNGTETVTYITYNAQNQAVKAEVHGSDFSYYYTYEYTNGLAATMKRYSQDGRQEDVRRFTYDSRKRLIEERFGDNDASATYTYAYTYDNNDNLTKWEILYGANVIGWTTYENYDNNPTPYSTLKGVPYHVCVYPYNSLGKNNPGKKAEAVGVDESGTLEPEEIFTYTYTYTYNSESYPTKFVYGGDLSGANGDEFEYQCD